MRIDALDHFAVEIQHQAQHAVRRRVLRPEIDGETAQRCLPSSVQLDPTALLAIPDSVAFLFNRALNLSHATT